MEFLKKIREILEEIKLFSSKYIVLTIVLKIFTYSNVYFLLYMNRIAINAVSEAIISEDAELFRILQLAQKLAVCVLFEIISSTLLKYLQLIIRKIKAKYDDQEYISLRENAANTAILYYDDPSYYNKIKQASKYASVSFDIYNSLLEAVFTTITLVISFIITFKFNIVVACFTLLASVPNIIINKKLRVRQIDIEKELMRKQRCVDYLGGLFFNKNVEMEMQVYGYFSLFLERIRKMQEELRRIREEFANQSIGIETRTYVLGRAAFFFQELYLILSIIRYKLGLGDFSYIIGIVNNLTNSVVQIGSLINGIGVDLKKYEEFKQISELNPTSICGIKKISDTDTEKIKLEFVNVSFKYPNTAIYALKNISFSMESGESVAIIGENGAGKTTIIKLILRFYEPTEGKIFINGINIQEYDISSYRKLFSVMFQEMLLYLLPIRDNIIISDIDNTEKDDAQIQDILNKLGFSEYGGESFDINRNYGREFEKDGYIFSRGQQQRLYAARMLYRKGGIYILDEPAASMDVVSERMFIDIMEEQVKNKAILYITHRYNNMEKMKKIIVLEGGKVAEVGTHNELLNRNGIYKKLYWVQKMQTKTSPSVF